MAKFGQSTAQPNEQEKKLKSLNNKVGNYDTRIKDAGGKTPANPNEKSWFSSFLDVLARPQRTVTGAIAEWTDGDGSGFLDGLHSGWKGFTGEEKRDTDEILENFGWKDKKGKLDLHDIASFAGDVALDPLTYLTLGGSSAIKAGKYAGQGLSKADAIQKAGRSALNINIPFGKEFSLASKDKGLPKWLGDTLGIRRQGDGQLPSKLRETATKAPIVGDVLDKIGGVFNPRHVKDTMNPSAVKAVNTVKDSEMELNALTNQSVRDTKNEWEQISKEIAKKTGYKLTNQDRSDISHFIQNPTLLEEIPSGTWSPAKAKAIFEAMQYQKKNYNDIFQKEVDLGLINPESKRPNYVFQAYDGKMGSIADVQQVIKDRGASSTLGSSKERSFETIKDAQQYLEKYPDLDVRPIDDSVELLARRRVDSVKSQVRQQMYQTLRSLGDGIVSDAPVMGHTKIKTGDLAGKYVHPDVAYHLGNLERLMTNDSYFEGALKLAHTATNWFKSLVAIRPGFAMRNLQGNLMMMYMAGMKNPKYLKDAFQEVRKFDDARLQGKSSEMMEEALKRGIIRQGRFIGDFDAVNPYASLGKNPLTKLDQTARQGYGFIDDVTRLALFKWAKESTGSYDKASETVKKYLFNYQELTPTERNLFRLAMPFYTWTRNIIPFLVNRLGKSPGTFSKFESLIDNARDDRPIQEETLPEWMRGDYFQTGDSTFYNMFSPLQDAKNLNPFELGETVVGGANPFVKTAFEGYMGKNMLTDQPTTTGEALLNNTSGIVRDIGQDIFAPLRKGEYGQKDMYNALNDVLGVSLRDINPQKEEVSRLYEYLELLEQEKQKLQRNGADVRTINEIQGKRKKPLRFGE
jgi:hypothetical protein